MKASLIVRLGVTFAFGMAFPLTMVTPARAVTGAVSGNFKFWNKNGNFCPSTNGCVGSVYPQSLYNKPLPVSNAMVWISDGSFNKIGQGVTDDSGNFNVSWTANSQPEKIQALIFSYHKDGRFWFANTLGQLVNCTSGTFPTAASSSVSNPQSVGNRIVG